MDALDELLELQASRNPAAAAAVSGPSGTAVKVVVPAPTPAPAAPAPETAPVGDELDQLLAMKKSEPSVEDLVNNKDFRTHDYSAQFEKGTPGWMLGYNVEKRRKELGVDPTAPTALETAKGIVPSALKMVFGGGSALVNLGEGLAHRGLETSADIVGNRIVPALRDLELMPQERAAKVISDSAAEQADEEAKRKRSETNAAVALQQAAQGGHHTLESISGLIDKGINLVTPKSMKPDEKPGILSTLFGPAYRFAPGSPEAKAKADPLEEYAAKVEEHKQATGLAQGNVQDTGMLAQVHEALTGDKPSQTFETQAGLQEMGAGDRIYKNPITGKDFNYDAFLRETAAAGADPSIFAFKAIPSVAPLLKGAGAVTEAAANKVIQASKLAKTAVAVGGATTLAGGAIALHELAPELLHSPKTLAIPALTLGAALLARPLGRFAASAGEMGMGGVLPETVGPAGVLARKALLGAAGGGVIGGALAAGSDEDIMNGIISGGGMGLAFTGTEGYRPEMARAAFEGLVRRGKLIKTGNQFEPVSDAIVEKWSPEDQRSWQALKAHLFDGSGTSLVVLNRPDFATAVGSMQGQGRFVANDTFAASPDGKTIYINADGVGDMAGLKDAAHHETGHAIVEMLRDSGRAEAVGRMADGVKQSLGEHFNEFANEYSKHLASSKGIDAELEKQLGRKPTPDEVTAELQRRGGPNFGDELLSEMTAKILRGESLGNFALSKPIMEKVADGVNSVLEKMGIKTGISDKSDLDFKGRSVDAGVRFMRDALYEQGGKAREVRLKADQRAEDIASGKVEPSVPERQAAIDAELAQIAAKYPDPKDITPSDARKRRKLQEEKDELADLTPEIQVVPPGQIAATPAAAPGQQPGQPAPSGAPAPGQAPSGAPPAPSVDPAVQTQMRADVEKALVAMGFKKADAKARAAQAQGNDTGEMLANALGGKQAEPQAPTPQQAAPAAQPAATPAAPEPVPQDISGLNLGPGQTPATPNEPQPQAQPQASPSVATPVAEPPAPSVPDVLQPPGAPPTPAVPTREQVAQEQIAAARAATPEGSPQRAIVDALADNLNRVVWAKNYHSAKAGESQGQAGEAVRGEEIRAQSVKKRQAGEQGTMQDKPFIPVSIHVNKAGEPYARGFDVDLWLSNLRHVVDFMGEKGIPNPLAGDANLQQILGDYVWNQVNGYQGSGLGELVAPGPGYELPTPNPDAAPRPLAQDPAAAQRIADLLNMALNVKPADMKGDKVMKALALSAMNAPGRAQGIEVNPVRAELEAAGFDTAGKLSSRSPFTTTLNSDMMKGGITTEPIVHGEGGRTVRPHGFDLNLKEAFAPGRPHFEAGLAGFKPEKTGASAFETQRTEEPALEEFKPKGLTTQNEVIDPKTGRRTYINQGRLAPEEAKAASDSLSQHAIGYDEALRKATTSGADEDFDRIGEVLPKTTFEQLGLDYVDDGSGNTDFFPTSDSGLRLAGRGGESVTFLGPGDVAYKIFPPSINPQTGMVEGIGIEGNVAKTPSGRWQMQFQSGTIGSMLEKLHVLGKIGGIPSEVAGVTPEGALVVKQPRYGNKIEGNAAEKFILAHDKAQLEQIGKQIKDDPKFAEFNDIQRVAVVDGQPYFIGDMRGSNFAPDTKGNFRVTDAVVGRVPQEMIDQIPALKEKIDRLTAVEDKMRNYEGWKPEKAGEEERQGIALSIAPGYERGFNKGFTFPQLQDVHNRVMRAVSPDGKTFKFLNDVGIKNEIIPALGSFQGKQEPAFTLSLPDQPFEKQVQIASLMGDALLQDAAIPYQFTDAGNQFGLILEPPKGKNLTPEQIKEFTDWAKEHGQDFSMFKDRGEIVLFDGKMFGNEGDYTLEDFGKFADPITERMQALGLTSRGFKQNSQYIHHAEYQDINQNAVRSEGSSDLQASARDSLYQPSRKAFEGFFKDTGFKPEGQFPSAGEVEPGAALTGFKPEKAGAEEPALADMETVAPEAEQPRAEELLAGFKPEKKKAAPEDEEAADEAAQQAELASQLAAKPYGAMKLEATAHGRPTDVPGAKSSPVMVTRTIEKVPAKDKDGNIKKDAKGNIIMEDKKTDSVVTAEAQHAKGMIVRPMPNTVLDAKAIADAIKAKAIKGGVSKSKVTKDPAVRAALAANETVPKDLNKLSAENPDRFRQYAERSEAAIQKIADDPERMVNPNGYAEFMKEAGADGNIGTHPTGVEMLVKRPDEYLAWMQGGYHGDKTIPGTREAAMSGLDAVADMRKIAVGPNGPDPFIVALHHLWGTLSKQLGPMTQEAAFLRLISHPDVLEQIQRSLDGKYDLDTEQWKEVVQTALKATKGDYGVLGNNATSNANSYRLMLGRHNGKWDDVAAVYANDDAVRMRSQFWGLGHGPTGIKNKVQGFIGLTFGVKGSVLDRWRFVDLHLPMAMKLKGSTSPMDYFKYVGPGKNIPQDPMGIYKLYGSMENGNPVVSMALYGGVDRAIQGAIDNHAGLREYLGDHADPGGLHWVVWNAIKNEAVGHSSLDITKNFIKEYGDKGLNAENFLDHVGKTQAFVEGSDEGGNVSRLTMDKGVFSLEKNRQP